MCGLGPLLRPPKINSTKLSLVKYKNQKKGEKGFAIIYKIKKKKKISKTNNEKERRRERSAFRLQVSLVRLHPQSKKERKKKGNGLE
jgi:hypothetical protein